MQSPAHKMKLFYFFIFLLCICVVNAYHPGENISLDYKSIVDVSYPCILKNNTVYLSGDITIGEQECTIYYYNYSEGQEESGSTSGGYLRTICNYTSCINNKTIKMCRYGNNKYNITIKCISNKTVIVPFIKSNQTITITKSNESTEFNQTLVMQPLNETILISPPDKPEKKSYVWLIIIVILIGGIVIFLLIMWMGRYWQ
jgi:hypothetical protein